MEFLMQRFPVSTKLVCVLALLVGGWFANSWTRPSPECHYIPVAFPVQEAPRFEQAYHYYIYSVDEEWSGNAEPGIEPFNLLVIYSKDGMRPRPEEVNEAVERVRAHAVENARIPEQLLFEKLARDRRDREF